MVSEVDENNADNDLGWMLRWCPYTHWRKYKRGRWDTAVNDLERVARSWLYTTLAKRYMRQMREHCLGWMLRWCPYVLTNPGEKFNETARQVGHCCQLSMTLGSRVTLIIINKPWRKGPWGRWDTANGLGREFRWCPYTPWRKVQRGRWDNAVNDLEWRSSRTMMASARTLVPAPTTPPYVGIPRK